MLFLVICYALSERLYCTGWTFVLTQSGCSYVLNIDVIVFLTLSVGNFISGAGDHPVWQNRVRTTLVERRFPQKTGCQDLRRGHSEKMMQFTYFC